MYDCTTQDKFKEIQVHTALRATCFSIAGVKPWNGLRIALRNCKNIFAFKKKHLNFIDIKGIIFYSETCINYVYCISFWCIYALIICVLAV